MNCIDLKNFNCCGCGACANICPQNAITMKENEEGFYVPFIDKEKCTDCGLCAKKCPQLNNIEKNTLTPECYAVMADDETRMKSSSGGAFTVIANEILNRDGLVVGAAFDENWTVKHIIVDDEAGLEKLRGSKYVQSFISETLMKEIKENLNNNRWVLFTGCPCQVAGLKSYLGKDYDTLLTVDLICSKVPPRKVFNKFINDNYDKSQIKNILFRDKSNGWNCSTTSILVGDKTEKSKDWFKMYLNSLSMNESCVNCKYMSIDRVSDITIGDFWGIAKIKSALDDKKGTSCILLNNSKGKEFFEKLNWMTKEEMTTQNAIDGNRALLVPFIPHQNRKLFTKKVMDNKFNECVNKLLSTKYNVGILNWWWNSNRGAILTCYAIQEVVKELGFNPSVIQHIPYDYRAREYVNSISEKFANKYLNLTEWCHSRMDMRRLNEKFDTFMVGSDQVWNHNLNWFLQDFYYLNFSELTKNKIACAASFGTPNFTGNPIVTKMVEYYFKRFNHISVREENAVDLLNNTFDVDGTFILDPVFLIDKSKYENIIKDSNKTEKKYIAHYFIHDNVKNIECLNKISDKMGLPTVNIKADGLPVEDWLYYIKNAELVVSDSFHASCFSIMFNKKFITLRNKPISKDARLTTLSNLTGLYSRFMNIIDFDINNLNLYLQDENWEEIERKLAPEKQRSIAWLKNALEDKDNKSYTKEQEYVEAFYASMDDRLNYLEGKAYSNSIKITNLRKRIKSYITAQKKEHNEAMNQTKYSLYLLKNKNRIIFKYRVYNLLSGILPIKILKDKKLKYKDRYLALKNI